MNKDQLLSRGLTSSLLPKLSGVKSSRTSQQGMIHLSGVKSRGRNFFSVLINKSVSPDTLVDEQQGWRKEVRSPEGAAGMWQFSPQEQSWSFGQAVHGVGFSKGLLPTTLTAPQLLSARGPALSLGERWWSSSNTSSTPERGGKDRWDPHVVKVELPVWQPQSLGSSHGPEIPVQIQKNLDY